MLDGAIRFFLFLAENPEGESKVPWFIDPDSGGLVLWTAISFGVVLVILYRTAWNKILEGLDAREKKIRGDIEAAEKNRLESQRLLEEYKHKLEAIKAEAAAIIEEGHADKKRIIEEAHAKATAETEETKARAIHEIELAKGKAIDELRKSTVKLAVQLAEKVVGAEVDQTKHRRLIDEALASYDKPSRN
jgi:F-type H+-transporting ATPase subunit b